MRRARRPGCAGHGGRDVSGTEARPTVRSAINAMNRPGPYLGTIGCDQFPLTSPGGDTIPLL
jgi:hypothetical protein